MTFRESLEEVPSQFPGFRHLYELMDPFSARTFVAQMDLSVEEGLALLRAEAQVNDPPRARWVAGSSTPADVVWPAVNFPLIVSDRIVEVLEAGRLSGWTTRPIEFEGKGGEAIEGFNILAICGRCGPLDYSLSKTIEKKYPGGIFPTWKGLYFDPATWDGSDMFMPTDNVGFCFVTDRVKKAFHKALVRNVDFICLEEIERLQPSKIDPSSH